MIQPRQIRFLLADDEMVFRDRLARSLESRGYLVAVAANHAEAVQLARQEAFTHGVVDLKMPGPSGLELIRDLLALQPELQLLVLTGYGSIASALEAVRLGAVDYLNKPADTGQILRAFSAPIASGRRPPEFEVPSLHRVEWEHIQRVLHECGGNISRASEVLGINRRSLQRKLNKYPDAPQKHPGNSTGLA